MIIGEKQFNKDKFLLIAGPCAVENIEQLELIANRLKINDIHFLRGGAYKPRTNIKNFQGLGVKGVDLLKRIKKETGLLIVSEIMDYDDIDIFIDNVDLIQVGSRNMNNYSLLKKLGRVNKPILLKRGLASKIQEWIDAAEYITSGGNKDVILCERGIRTFENSTRNTLDLSAVAYIKKHTDFPILVDPSHGTGIVDLIIPMSKAAVMAGADGLMVEIHPTPESALCDGDQSLNLDQFDTLISEMIPLCKLVGKTII